MSDRLDRTRLRPIMLLGLFVALVSICAGLDSALARTQTLVVETVPAIKGIHLRLDGKTFVTDESGVAAMTTETTKQYGTLKVDERSLVGDSQRVAFVAWSDGATTAERAVEFPDPAPLQVGFNVDYLVREEFRASNGDTIDARRVDSFTIVDDTNDSTTFEGSSSGLAGPTALPWERFPPGTRWLRGVRVVHQNGVLQADDVSYEVRSVVIEGERSTVSSQPFVPSAGATWPIAVGASSALPGWIVGGGAALLFAIGALIGLAGRDRRPKSTVAPDAVDHSERLPESIVPPGPSAERSNRVRRGIIPDRMARRRPPAQVYVRVRLRNGRTVEGWKMKVPNARDSQAINVNVRYVYGPDGEQIAPRPVDSILLASQIVDVQIRDEPPSPSQLGPSHFQPDPTSSSDDAGIPDPAVTDRSTAEHPGVRPQ